MRPSTMRPGAIALVTGASSGIGLALTRALLARELNVIGVARNLERLQAAFPQPPEQLALRALDVNDGSAVAGFLDSLPAAWRGVDILIANAGSDVGGRRRFDEGRIEDFVSTITTNVSGLMRVCHAIIPGMLARERGHVVTLGSTAGVVPYAGGAAYNASKFAVHGFTDALRLDYRNSPVRITEIMPGLVRTGFAYARNPSDEAAAKRFYDDAPATLEPEHIVAAIVFALEQPPQMNVAQMLVTPTGNK